MLYTPKPVNAVCVLIPKGMFVLGVSKKDDASKWGLPGGKVEPGETPWAAASRELREETGLVAAPTSMVEILIADCGDWRVAAYYTERYSGAPTKQEGEGWPAWISWGKLIEGPYGDYNRQLKEQWDRFWPAFTG